MAFVDGWLGTHYGQRLGRGAGGGTPETMPAPDAATDRHAGDYTQNRIAFISIRHGPAPLPDMNRQRRIAFVISISTDALSKLYAPAYFFFAKGGDAEKLIIVNNQTGRLDAVYRARALLATMTSIARTMPILREHQVRDWFTFLRSGEMMGFEKVALSDGNAFAHQVIVK